MLVMMGAVLLTGCRREHRYSQETPDDVIRSAVEMIKNNEARRLGGLIYADSDEMRATLDRLGVLLGNMQKLSAAVQKRFPAELAAMKEEAIKQAAAGKGGLMATIGIGPGGVSAGRGGPPDEEVFRGLVNRLFADPYGWIDANAPRLTTMMVSDDMATVLLDDQPVIPVIGLPMKQEDGRWYVVLPINVPGASEMLPRTRQEWTIIRSVVQVLDNAVVEMTGEVESGGARSLDSLADKAQEKLIFPGMIALAAYNKEMEVRRSVERRVKQYQSRQREWAKSRKGEAEGKAVSPKLLGTLSRLAAGEIEELARQRKPFAVEQMTDVDFEELAGGWLAKNGLSVRLDSDLSGDAVDSVILAWEKAKKTAVARK